ncbi:DUF1496 domain-containing protein [Aeromonas australiensis]|uniref:DUF1496 domain-containing protein n=1 Tax=Aeromonas australiensis TaxID=1114880 RepID=UPI000589C05B|nr:DUF1496 domain-containing protein [Aeromonas australiensis]
MRNLLLCLLPSLWLVPALAAPKTTVVGDSASPELLLPLGSLPERVCWFADQKYSEGARILQGDIWLVCGPLNDLESNGPLAWRSPAVVLPATRGAKDQKTISVGQ